MRYLPPLILALAAAFLPAAARADLVLTFDELAADTPADGATVAGIRFGFSGPFPGDAYYNSSTLLVGPGDAVGLAGAVLEGDSAGILTIDFAVPTDVLAFNVLLSSTDPLAVGLTVTLFDASLASLGTTVVATAPGATTLFSEGSFTRSGGPAIRRAVLDFNDAPGRFALDNLRAVPEPSSLALAALGGAILAGLGLRRRDRTRP